MNKQPSKKNSFDRKDYFLIVFLFLFGLCFGLGHFHSLRTDKPAIFPIELLYGPAVMMASGHGFISPDLLEHPELREFLRGDRESLSLNDIPETIKTAPSTVAAYHRYLLYTVGVIWHMFGISWKHLEPLIAIMLGWYALSLYILLRFFLSRFTACLLSIFLVLSPAVFIILPDLRDFSKAPFTLTLFCLLIWLFRKRSQLQLLIAGALALGIIHGISLGFRQDAIIFLPLCAGILFFPFFFKANGPLWKRGVPLLLYLAVFFILATPMLRRMEGGAQPQHILVQGFASDRMDMLGMKQAPYRALLSGADFYNFSALADYASRTPDLERPYAFNGLEVTRAGQRWLQEALFLYPADIATRGWTALWRILRYADAFPPSLTEPTPFHAYLNSLHRTFAFFMHRTGLILSVLALAFVAARRPYIALFLFLATAYILGYTGLQAVSRHSFHLSFYPFLITAFLIESFVAVIRQRRRVIRNSKQTGFTPYRHCVAVLSICAVLIFLPLLFLQWYQGRQLSPILEELLEAERTPLAFSKKNDFGWSVFSLESPKVDRPSGDLSFLYRLLAETMNPENKLWNVRTRYLMAEFDNSPDLNYLLHCYTSQIEGTNFSQLLRIPKTTDDGNTLRYFFPVYELLKPQVEEKDGYIIARNHFRGIALPESVSDHLLGLYEITVPSKVSRPMSFVSVDEKTPAPLYLIPQVFPDPIFYYQTEHTKHNNTIFSEAARRFGTREDAIVSAEAQFLLSTDHSVLFSAADNLLRLGCYELFVNHCRQTDLEESSKKEILTQSLISIAELALDQDRMELCIDALDSLDAIASDVSITSALMRIEAYERAGSKEKALKGYQTYLQRYPDDFSTAFTAHIVMSDFFSPKEKATFWQRLIDSTPEQAYFYRYLALAYDLQNEEGLAKEACNTAYHLAPEDPKNKLYKIIIDADLTPLEELKEQISVLAAAHPEEHFFIAERLEKEAWYLSEGREHNHSGELLLLAATFSNNPDLFTLKALQQFTGAGEYERAEKGFLPLLESALATEATQALYITTKLHRDILDRLDFWLALQKNHPQNHPIENILSTVYEDSLRTLFTSGRLEELDTLPMPAVKENEEPPIYFAYPLIARYIIGKERWDTIQSLLPRLKKDREMILSDTELLRAHLTGESNSELFKRITTLLDCIQR